MNWSLIEVEMSNSIHSSSFDTHDVVSGVRSEMDTLLGSGLTEFWLTHGIDEQYGGYLTCFDRKGMPVDPDEKYLVTQTRMVWGFSALYRRYPHRRELLDAANQGAEFLIKAFWDREYSGWLWRVSREGECLDDGKLAYGQSFALYALAEHYAATMNTASLDYAMRTFDLLVRHFSDTCYGGYYENMEPDFTICEPGFDGGDRKSLDIHMHLLEAYTRLLEVSYSTLVERRLTELITVIRERMIDKEYGCGGNQFTLDFTPVPPIDIRRTWNAERGGTFGSEPVEGPNTTSYGHNVELAWLLNRALTVCKITDSVYDDTLRGLVDHALRHGLDTQHGGVFRDGPYDGPAFNREKEWWQNCESMVGYLDAYQHFGDEVYLNAFVTTWDFNKRFLINWECGEWHQLATEDGKIITSDLGNPWKCMYHSGRTLLECTERLAKIQAEVTA